VTDISFSLLHGQLRAGEPNRPSRREGHREHVCRHPLPCHRETARANVAAL